MSNKPQVEKHVLIVEDEPDFAALLASILVNAGYGVTTAYNGEDALSHVHRSRPDVITLDMQMPKESGPLFYRKLKKDEKFRHIPVIVVTGVTRDDADMKTLVQSLLASDNLPHPDAYLEKPVDGPSLLGMIEDAMSTDKRAAC